MKKLLALVLASLMVLSLVGCAAKPAETTAAPTQAAVETTAAPETTPAPVAKTTIYVLGPTPDHGWTAQAGTYAQAKCDEITKGGKYKATYIPASSGEQQVDQVNTIIANGDAAGVVFFALEDSAKAGQEALIAENIPFISFDRIIEGPDKKAILNASGDNWQCGAGIAYWLQKNGMEPGDVMVTLIGDNGTVCSRRQEGFEKFLLGELKYHDEAENKDYETTKKWTQEEIDALKADYKNVCNWSADGAYGYLEQKMEEITNKAKAKNNKLYVFSMDDEMTFGLLNLLEGNALSDKTKKDIKDMKVYVSAIGGMQELYDVMAGKAAQSGVAKEYFDDVMSVYFSPKMINNVITKMVDYLDKNNWTYQVGEGKYEPVWIVDKNNVADNEGFTGH